MKRLSILLTMLFYATVGFSQNVGINEDGSTPHASAMLDVVSTSKGFLAPRMTENQRLAIGSPATALLVYQINSSDYDAGYYYYDGEQWVQIGSATGASQWTSAGSNIYYSTGNVGIGTLEPNALLELNGGIGAAAIKVDNTAYLEFGAGLTKEVHAGKIGYQTFTADALDIVGAGTDGSNRKIKFWNEGGATFTGQVVSSLFTGSGDPDGGMYSSADGTLNFKTDNTERVRITDRIYSTGGYSFLSGDTDGGIYSPADGTMTFFTDNTERMRLDPNGYLNLGTTTAAGVLLHVNGHARLGLGSRLVLPASGSENLWNLDNIGGTLRIFREDFNATGAGGNGDVFVSVENSGVMEVKGGTTDDQVSPLRLKNSNTASNYWKVGPNKSNYFIIFNESNAGTYISPGATSWSSTSDRRLKENIIPLNNALEGILSLQGVKYNFIGNDKTEIGVIAQEVQNQFPEMISEKDGYLGVAYDRLGPVLIEAIKEQQKQIEALKAEIELLKSK